MSPIASDSLRSPPPVPLRQPMNMRRLQAPAPIRPDSRVSRPISAAQASADVNAIAASEFEIRLVQASSSAATNWGVTASRVAAVRFDASRM